MIGYAFTSTGGEHGRDRLPVARSFDKKTHHCNFFSLHFCIPGSQATLPVCKEVPISTPPTVPSVVFGTSVVCVCTAIS